MKQWSPPFYFGDIFRLETVSLVVYDKSGTPAASQNANQYLVDKHAAAKPKTELPIMTADASTIHQSSGAEITNKYKDITMERRQDSQGTPAPLKPVTPLSITPLSITLKKN